MKENKLIAEFMDLNVVTIKDIKRNKNPYITSADGYTIQELKYKTSWDWLMPVVETCYHNGAEENEIGDITHALLDCDINDTYNAVVQFINQYNKTNDKR